MAFTESDRVQIRRYLGFSSLFLQADPRLESAITASQAVSDGGTRPDNSLETQIKADLTYCQAVDTAIAALRPVMGATSVGRKAVEIDTAREHARLKNDGSTIVGRLATALDVERYWDPFYQAEVRRNPTQRYPYVRNPYSR
jgi:hypothetical protein